MPTHIEKELGIAPTTNRLKRWFRRLRSDETLTLDPLTVNYEAWLAVRHNVREWPHYLEAPNCIDVLVSLEDWDEYWGIDTERKEANVSAYVHSRCAKKGYWMAGEPQVYVSVDESIEAGELEVCCQFVNPQDTAEPKPLKDQGTAVQMPVTAVPPFLQTNAEVTARLTLEELEAARAAALAQDVPQAPEQPAPRPDNTWDDEPEDDQKELPTLRFMDAERDGVAFLVGEGAFRLEIHSGDCIGVVRWGEEVPPEVNVRLDAEAFPYAEVMQCTLAVQDGRWTVRNHAARGTRLDKCDGSRYMLGEPDPCPIDDGDVLWLGPERPLRFEL